MPENPLIAVRGGGDLGSACALRLIRCGMRVVIAERPLPTAVRRTVAFSEAVFDGTVRVEEIEGVLAHDQSALASAWTRGQAPIVVDPEMEAIAGLHPDVVVDALMAKQNRGMRLDLAPGTVAVGPGFWAGRDVHAVIETNRGPNLGRVIWDGEAEMATHMPSPVLGHDRDRVLRAPRDGILKSGHEIGAVVDENEPIGEVSGAAILAPFRGLIRGLLRSPSEVEAGMKIGDLDPRLNPSLCDRVSDKALAVAGGAVEATFVLLRGNGWEMCRLATSADTS